MAEAVNAIVVLSILMIALSLGVIPATIAARKGRGFLIWWLFGTALFPIALPISMSLKTSGA